MVALKSFSSGVYALAGINNRCDLIDTYGNSRDLSGNNYLLQRHIDRNKKAFDSGVSSAYIGRTTLSDGVCLHYKTDFIPVVECGPC